LTGRIEDGQTRPILVWRPVQPWLAASTGPLGGGLGARHWVLNMTVPMSYDRPDPAAHLADVARGLDLDGPGVGLMTGVDVTRHVSLTESNVVVTATVGMRRPVWAAAPDEGVGDDGAPPVGTVNIVAWVPARLSDAALVNAVATVVEARAQAMWELGLSGTGTPSDAICVLCPTSGPARAYGGTRSHWGSRLARAVHAAVRQGGLLDAGASSGTPAGGPYPSS
jgi:adenosylcobinamide amidohydrolase